MRHRAISHREGTHHGYQDPEQPICYKLHVLSSLLIGQTLMIGRHEAAIKVEGEQAVLQPDKVQVLVMYALEKVNRLCADRFGR